jgi:hypothetical protein
MEVGKMNGVEKLEGCGTQAILRLLRRARTIISDKDEGG